MYHAQIINGGRFAEMRTKDYFLAAIILFLDFLLLYLFSFQVAPKWSDRCDGERSKNVVLFTETTTNSYPPKWWRTSTKGMISYYYFVLADICFISGIIQNIQLIYTFLTWFQRYPLKSLANTAARLAPNTTASWFHFAFLPVKKL